MIKLFEPEVNAIKAKVGLRTGLILALIALGALNLGQILIIEPKYVICISGAVFFLFLAAVSCKISVGCRTIIIIKIWRWLSFVLMGASLITLILLPPIIAGMNFQGYEQSVSAMNLGIILLLVFLNELMHNLKEFRKRRIKLQSQDLTATYFEQLPKITQNRKKAIYFEFD